MKALCARKKRLAAAVGLILAAGLGYAAWVRATGWACHARFMR